MKILFCICTALSMFFSVWAVLGQIKLRKMRDRLNELECCQYPQQKRSASEEHRCKGYPFVDISMVFHLHLLHGCSFVRGASHHVLRLTLSNKPARWG